MTGQTEEAKLKARETYDAAADHFDAPPLAFWSRIGTATVARLDLKPGASVLDVGCGNGASLLPAAEAVGPEGYVVGVDLSPRLLEQGRAKAEAAGLSNIEFREGDMTKLDYPEGSFDAVVSVFSIFFVPDMEDLVAKLWKLVRPGGQLAVTTWGPGIFQPVYAHWLETLEREQPDMHSAFNPWDRITDIASVERLMLDGGTSHPRVEAEESTQSLRSPDDWWACAMGSGLRWAIDHMDEDTRERVRRENIDWVSRNGVEAIGTNAIYAVAEKPGTGA